MRPNVTCVSWVVYRMTMPKQAVGGNVVCEQAEWDAIELARPGYHTLLYSGIKTEQEAEKLARGNAGDFFRRGSGKKAHRAPDAAPLAVPAVPTV
jgi:hypothetical protein